MSGTGWSETRVRKAVVVVAMVTTAMLASAMSGVSVDRGVRGRSGDLTFHNANAASTGVVGSARVNLGTWVGANLGSGVTFSQKGTIHGVPEDSDSFGGALATGDFDGDGYDDVAIGVPREVIGYIPPGSLRPYHGAINVLYGGPDGLDVARNQAFSQRGPIAGTPEGADRSTMGDLFGASLTAADFDNDGFDDLAIGAPGESIGDIGAAGIVHVLRGSELGLTVEGNRVLSQLGEIRGAAERGDRFGESLAAGDINGDGFDDLVVGVPRENIGAVWDAGIVHVLYGSADGLRTDNDQLLSQNHLRGVTPEREDEFGSALAVGDFNIDGFDDIAIGVPLENFGGEQDVGVVHVVYGSRSGITAAGDQLWTQRPLVGTPEGGDRFGESLAAGDFGGDGDDDLAIGVPHEDIIIPDEHRQDGRWPAQRVGAGMVDVIYGSPSGLSSHQTDGLTQHRRYYQGNYGDALAAGDLDGDGRDDLAVVAPNFTDGTGDPEIHLLAGGTSGLTDENPDRLQTFTAAALGFDHDRSAEWTVATGDFNGDTAADLAIGFPDALIDGAESAGAVHVLYGRTTASLQNTTPGP